MVIKKKVKKHEKNNKNTLASNAKKVGQTTHLKIKIKKKPNNWLRITITIKLLQRLQIRPMKFNTQKISKTNESAGNQSECKRNEEQKSKKTQEKKLKNCLL